MRLRRKPEKAVGKWQLSIRRCGESRGLSQDTDISMFAQGYRV